LETSKDWKSKNPAGADGVSCSLNAAFQGRGNGQPSTLATSFWLPESSGLCREKRGTEVPLFAFMNRYG